MLILMKSQSMNNEPAVTVNTYNNLLQLPLALEDEL